MASKGKKYGDFLNELSMMRWSEFMTLEHDESVTTSNSIVLSLIRACAMESLPAIKTAIDRIDGRPETPIQVVLPKVFYLYPNAISQPPTIFVEEAQQVDVELVEHIELPGENKNRFPSVDIEVEPSAVPGFKHVIEIMSDYPRSVPATVIDQQVAVEKYMRNKGPKPTRDPRVQSVVGARILKMAQEGKIDAVNDIIDRIDGKSVEKFRVVGADMYISMFDSVAPAGAYLNEDGVYQMEATQTQKMWQEKLNSK